MSVFIRLRNLHWSASPADVRKFFRGLSIPEGGVNVIGGNKGEAFIAFETEHDGELALRRDNFKLKGTHVKLRRSSKSELDQAIEDMHRTDLNINSRERFASSDETSIVASQETLPKPLNEDQGQIWDKQKSNRNCSYVNPLLLSPGFERNFRFRNSPRDQLDMDRIIMSNEEKDGYHFQIQEPQVKFVDDEELLENSIVAKRLLKMSGTIDADETFEDVNIYDDYYCSKDDYEGLRPHPENNMTFQDNFPLSSQNFATFINFFPDNSKLCDAEMFPSDSSYLQYERSELTEDEPPENYLQSTAMFKNSKQHSIPNYAIKLSGLPSKTTYKDLQLLMKGFFTPQCNVKFAKDEKNKTIGVAFVRMSNYDDYQSVLRLKNLKIDDVPILLEKCPDNIFYTKFRYETEPSRLKKMRRNEKQDYCFMLKGLPYATIEDDILDFFSGLQLIDFLILYDENRQATGVGYVQFEGKTDYIEAIERNGRKIGRRYIEMFNCNHRDIKNARQSAVVVSKPLNEVLNFRLFRRRNQELQQNLPQKRPLCAVMSGLPFTITTAEVFTFFEGCGIQPNAVHNILTDNLCPSGRAFIEFNDLFDFDIALKQQGKCIGGNAIAIKQVLFDEMVKILESHQVQFDFNEVRKQLASNTICTLPEKLPYIWEPPEEMEHISKPSNSSWYYSSTNSSISRIADNGDSNRERPVKKQNDLNDDAYYDTYHDHFCNKLLANSNEQNPPDRHDVFSEGMYYLSNQVQVIPQTSQPSFFEDQTFHSPTLPEIYRNEENDWNPDSFQTPESNLLYTPSDMCISSDIQRADFYNDSTKRRDNILFHRQDEPKFLTKSQRRRIRKRGRLALQPSGNRVTESKPTNTSAKVSKPIHTNDKMTNSNNNKSAILQKKGLTEGSTAKVVSNFTAEKGKNIEDKVILCTKEEKTNASVLTKQSDSIKCNTDRTDANKIAVACTETDSAANLDHFLEVIKEKVVEGSNQSDRNTNNNMSALKNNIANSLPKSKQIDKNIIISGDAVSVSKNGASTAASCFASASTSNVKIKVSDPTLVTKDKIINETNNSALLNKIQSCNETIAKASASITSDLTLMPVDKSNTSNVCNEKEKTSDFTVITAKTTPSTQTNNRITVANTAVKIKGSNQENNILVRKSNKPMSVGKKTSTVVNSKKWVTSKKPWGKNNSRNRLLIKRRNLEIKGTLTKSTKPNFENGHGKNFRKEGPFSLSDNRVDIPYSSQDRSKGSYFSQDSVREVPYSAQQHRREVIYSSQDSRKEVPNFFLDSRREELHSFRDISRGEQHPSRDNQREKLHSSRDRRREELHPYRDGRREELLSSRDNRREELLSSRDNRREELLSSRENRREKVLSFRDSRREEPLSFRDNRREELLSSRDNRREELLSSRENRREKLLPFRDTRREEPLSFRDSRREEPLSFRDSRREEPLFFRDSRREEPLSFRDSRREEPLPFQDSRREEPYSSQDDRGKTSKRDSSWCSQFYEPEHQQYLKESHVEDTEKALPGSEEHRKDTIFNRDHGNKRSLSLEDSESYHSKKSKCDDYCEYSSIQYNDSSRNLNESESCVVHASIVSPKIGLEEIFHFFQDFHLTSDDVIRKYTQFGDITGDVRIAFESPQEAKRAIKYLNGSYLAGNKISLTLV